MKKLKRIIIYPVGKELPTILKRDKDNLLTITRQSKERENNIIFNIDNIISYQTHEYILDNGN